MTGSRNGWRGSSGPALLDPVRDEAAPLDARVRAEVERAMGVPFGDVVVHSGARSSAVAEDLDAAAFSVGRHIVFNADRYDPASVKGRALLVHELTHVAQQRRGGGDLDAGERMPAAELPVHSGAVEAEARGHADPRRPGGGAAEASGETGAVASSVGVARQTKAEEKALPAPTVPMFEYKDETGAVKRVTMEEAAKLRAEAAKRLRSALNNVESTAAIWRESHREHLDMGHAESFGDLWDKPSRIFGVAANMRAGVVPPPLSMWGHATRVVADARKALDAGDLAEAGRLLRLATAHLNSSKAEWNTFIEASIGGAEKLTGELEVVRDTSFAIAVAAGAIVAAPVVAAGVALTPATGGTALALTAAGTGLTTAAGGAALRGTADVAAQKVATGKVDLSKTAKHVRANLKQDFITGMSAGLAPGAGQAAGLGSKGLSLAQNAGRNVAVQSGVAATTGVTGTVADTAVALGEGKTWDQAKEENLIPGLKQAAVSTVSSAASAPLGPLGQAVAKSKPLTGKVVEYGGDALVTGATTLATGGSLEDARNEALRSLVSSAATRGATQPSKTKTDASPAAKSQTEAPEAGAKTAAPQSESAAPPAAKPPVAETPAVAKTAPDEQAAPAAKAPADTAAQLAPPAKAPAETAPASPAGKAPAETVPTPAKAAEAEAAPAAAKALASSDEPAPAAAPAKTAAEASAAPATPAADATAQPAPAKPASAKKAAAEPGAPAKAVAEKGATAPIPTEPPAATAKPVRPSEALKKAEAGERMRKVAEGRHKVAVASEVEAGKRVATAKDWVGKAQKAIDDAQASGKPAPKALQKSLASAKSELSKAETAQTKAKTELATAKTRLEAATKTEANRQKVLDDAKAAKAAKAAAAANKPESEAEAARKEWKGSARAKQAEELGARPHEQLHHAIELDVLDIPEFKGAFSAKDLNKTSNMRVIPMEVNPADAALLDTARKSPQAQWPKEVKDAVEMVPASGGKKGDGPKEMPALKERSAEGRPATLHQSEIRKEWDRQYAAIKRELAAAEKQGKLLPGTPERAKFVREQLEAARDFIDFKYGAFWGQAKQEAGLR